MADPLVNVLAAALVVAVVVWLVWLFALKPGAMWSFLTPSTRNKTSPLKPLSLPLSPLKPSSVTRPFAPLTPSTPPPKPPPPPPMTPCGRDFVKLDPDGTGRPRLGADFPMQTLVNETNSAREKDVRAGKADLRYMVVYNASSQELWVGVTGSSWDRIKLSDTGFRLAPCTYHIVALPQLFSGRVWARTGCQWMRSSNPTTNPIFRGMSMDQMVPCPDANPDTGGPGCRLVCATGNCGAGNMLAAEAQCAQFSGQNPATLLEFTLGNGVNTPDFYDSSNVNGYTVGVLMQPLPNGRFKPVPGVDPKMTSTGPGPDQIGRSGCLILEDPKKWCPVELQYYDPHTKKMVCNSICTAIDDPNHFNHVLGGPKNETTIKHPEQVPTFEYTFPDGTKQKFNPFTWLQFLKTAPDWLNPQHIDVNKAGQRLQPTMFNRLCAQCGQLPGPNAPPMKGCEDDEKVSEDGKERWREPPLFVCQSGCSPYVTSYPSSWWSRRSIARCADGSRGCEWKADRRFDDPNKQLSSLPDWPVSLEGKDYAGVFADQCKMAYSWSFSDNSATFQSIAADYLVVFF